MSPTCIEEGPTTSRGRARHLICEADRIFVAYRTTDLKRVKWIQGKLRRLRKPKPKDSVFVAHESLEPGAKISRDEVDKALLASDLMVVVCGKLTDQSPEVDHEVSLANEHRIRTLPILLGFRARLPAKLNYAVQGIHLTSLFPGLKVARFAMLAGVVALAVLAWLFESERRDRVEAQREIDRSSAEAAFRLAGRLHSQEGRSEKALEVLSELMSAPQVLPANRMRYGTRYQDLQRRAPQALSHLGTRVNAFWIAADADKMIIETKHGEKSRLSRLWVGPVSESDGAWTPLASPTWPVGRVERAMTSPDGAYCLSRVVGEKIQEKKDGPSAGEEPQRHDFNASAQPILLVHAASTGQLLHEVPLRVERFPLVRIEFPPGDRRVLLTWHYAPGLGKPSDGYNYQFLNLESGVLSKLQTRSARRFQGSRLRSDPERGLWADAVSGGRLARLFLEADAKPQVDQGSQIAGTPFYLDAAADLLLTTADRGGPQVVAYALSALLGRGGPASGPAEIGSVAIPSGAGAWSVPGSRAVVFQHRSSTASPAHAELWTPERKSPIALPGNLAPRGRAAQTSRKRSTLPFFEMPEGPGVPLYLAATGEILLITPSGSIHAWWLESGKRSRPVEYLSLAAGDGNARGPLPHTRWWSGPARTHIYYQAADRTLYRRSLLPTWRIVGRLEPPSGFKLARAAVDATGRRVAAIFSQPYRSLYGADRAESAKRRAPAPRSSGGLPVPQSVGPGKGASGPIGRRRLLRILAVEPGGLVQLAEAELPAAPPGPGGPLGELGRHTDAAVRDVDGIAPLCWSPSGRRLLVGLRRFQAGKNWNLNSDPTELMLFEVTADAIVAKATWPVRQLPFTAGFAPDGRYIYYDTDTNEGGEGVDYWSAGKQGHVVARGGGTVSPLLPAAGGIRYALVRRGNGFEPLRIVDGVGTAVLRRDELLLSTFERPDSWILSLLQANGHLAQCDEAVLTRLRGDVRLSGRVREIERRDHVAITLDLAEGGRIHVLWGERDAHLWHEGMAEPIAPLAHDAPAWRNMPGLLNWNGLPQHLWGGIGLLEALPIDGQGYLARPREAGSWKVVVWDAGTATPLLTPLWLPDFPTSIAVSNETGRLTVLDRAGRVIDVDLPPPISERREWPVAAQRLRLGERSPGQAADDLGRMRLWEGREQWLRCLEAARKRPRSGAAWATRAP